MMLAQRHFTMQDQFSFAQLTGDRNPMHVDAVAARRTGAGRPVVHGVHNLLWCLNTLSKSLGALPAVSSLRVSFDSFLVVNETIETVLVKQDASGLRAEVKAGTTSILTVVVGFGPPQTVVDVREGQGDPFDGDEPLEQTLDQLTDRTGRVRPANAETVLDQAFPHAAVMLGPLRVAGLGTLTRLVGMVCPGLNSIFNGLSLKTCPISDETPSTIAYYVKTIDPRYHRLVQEVSGCGWAGTVTCSTRHPPARQPSMEFLRGLVAPDAFQGTRALIIGGSRGLGELTAKLIATGGGSVVITYATGRDDAEALMRSIRASGGSASILRYDILEKPGMQLAEMKITPTQLYYFATPVIGGRRSEVFSNTRLDQFMKYYVAGFASLMEALPVSKPDGLDVLYPSTVFVKDRPEGMTEYAMAKAAGEVLCVDLSRSRPGINILTPRLPRLSTDQTAGLQGLTVEDSVSPILQCIVALHRCRNEQTCDRRLN